MFSLGPADVRALDPAQAQHCWQPPSLVTVSHQRLGQGGARLAGEIVGGHAEIEAEGFQLSFFFKLGLVYRCILLRMK